MAANTVLELPDTVQTSTSSISDEGFPQAISPSDHHRDKLPSSEIVINGAETPRPRLVILLKKSRKGIFVVYWEMQVAVTSDVAHYTYPWTRFYPTANLIDGVAEQKNLLLWVGLLD